MIPRPGQSSLRLCLGFMHSVATLLTCSGHNVVSLMPILCCQLAMPPHDVFLRQYFLPVARVMRSDLRCRCTVDSLFPQMIFDLFSART
jgi:hypothetical protein